MVGAKGAVPAGVGGGGLNGLIVCGTTGAAGLGADC